MINYSHFRSSYHLLYVIKRYFGQVALNLVDLTRHIKFPLKLKGKLLIQNRNRARAMT